jgi:hypothetical protein
MFSKSSRPSDLLRSALLSQWPQSESQPHNWTQVDLLPLKSKGLAHDHIQILGTGWLARIPKQSQMQLASRDNLTYQFACFERASRGGKAPRCVQVLQPSEFLPRGALIVQEVEGRPAILPHDLSLIACSLAALHRIELPSIEMRAPLLNAQDPLQALWDEIAQQAIYLHRANLTESVKLAIYTELAKLKDISSRSVRPLKRLIAFDAHPGNFVVLANGEDAYLVDLEKCRYSYPSLDLAHATLYTSTTWDIESHAVLRLEEVLLAYQNWTESVDSDLALNAKQWHVPLRRAMWLWSITWCAKWRVLSGIASASAHDGEDWSDQNVDTTLSKHVRERVDHYLSDEGVAWVNAEFHELQRYL